ncbi:hypothetical protein [Citrobacter freundii]|uniref:gp53-like domain-containing protein n=1 Tax=Citrobacter freundii TaxID=546 RepID=UPI0015EBEC81|nr:hypothetical protein [Citrobacter freundii]HBU6364089.1 hypothetical protein [Citrobacter freundii]HDX3931138.1 hypothetical protein [Citrobacter freundii]
MFHLDNNSGVSAMPPVGTVQSSAPRWFTEGGGGTPASYPGADWYNIIQAELLNFLSAYGIAPDKADLSQLQKAIEAAIKDKATAKSPLLTAIAALVTSADKMPYFNGKDTVAMTALTAFAREVLAQTDAAGVLSKLGLSKVMIGDWGYKMGFIADIKDQPYINHQASGDNILLATLDAMTTALADKQNKDTTLTSLSGKSIAELRTYLELKSAALRDIGTGANQIPDMSVQGFGSNWIKTVGGMIIQKGSVLIPTGQNYATTAFPIPFLSGGVVNLTWSDTPSNTGTTSNITYGVVVGSNLNTGFQAWMAGAGGYNLTYIAIGY